MAGYTHLTGGARNDLEEIRDLLREINEKTTVYMSLQMMLESEYGEKREAKHEHVNGAQKAFGEINAKFKERAKARANSYRGEDWLI